MGDADTHGSDCASGALSGHEFGTSRPRITPDAFSDSREEAEPETLTQMQQLGVLGS
jgi:hypothetical protein